MITGIVIARRAICANRRIRGAQIGICALEPCTCDRCVCFGSTLPRQRGGRTPPRTHVSKDVKSVPERVALSAALSLGEAGRPRALKKERSVASLRLQRDLAAEKPSASSHETIRVVILEAPS